MQGTTMNALIEVAHHLADACERGHCVNFQHARELRERLTAARRVTSGGEFVRLLHAEEHLTRAFGSEVFKREEAA